MWMPGLDSNQRLQVQGLASYRLDRRASFWLRVVESNHRPDSIGGLGLATRHIAALSTLSAIFGCRGNPGRSRTCILPDGIGTSYQLNHRVTWRKGGGVEPPRACASSRLERDAVANRLALPCGAAPRTCTPHPRFTRAVLYSMS